MKLLFAGDLGLHYPSLDLEAGGAPTGAEFWENTASYFAAADFSMLNMESMFGERDASRAIRKDGPNQIAHPHFKCYVDALRPTALGLANNHVLDYGGDTLLANKADFERRGYKTAGAGRNLAEAYRPLYFEKGGEKLAVIAAAENEFGSAGRHTPGGAGYSLSEMTKAVFEAKAAGAAPIIFFHGGNERNPIPSPGKVALYRHFVDLGAAAVIAMHTHCPQGYETYHGAPIIYSMGNFYFPVAATRIEKPAWYVGYLSQITLQNGVCTFEPIPYSFAAGRHTVLAGEEKEKMLAYLAAISAPIHDPDRLQALFDAWCMFLPKGWIKGGWPKPETEHPFLPAMKNILSCEAHNEAFANVMKICFEGREEEASALIAQLEAWQRLEI